MPTRIRGSVAVLGLILLGCAGRRHVAERPHCPADWRPAWTEDSTVAVCLAPFFRPVAQRVGPTSFERGAPTDPEHAWFVVTADTALASILAWPPHLGGARECQTADCYVADSVVSHDDSLVQAVVHVETGLVTGGAEGHWRAPSFIGSGHLRAQRRIGIGGGANNSATLDTLRRMVRTARLAL